MEEAPLDGDQAAAGRDRSSGKTGKRGKRKSVKQSKSKAKPPLAIAMVEGPADGPPDRPEPEVRQEPVDHAVPHQHSALSVLVLNDSGPYPRACFWEHALHRLGHAVKLRSLVDPDEFFIKELNQYQVLIVNWDAINGDPSFGSDAALRWSEHRHPEVRWWVQSKGGILIIEGQARLSVPTQAAYDALLGPGQLRVSGPSDPSQAGIEEKRVGKRCRVTGRVGPNTPLGPFKGRELSSDQQRRTFVDMFPGAAGDLLLPLAPTDVSGRERGWNSLYRGWFTPRLPRPLGRWRLNWVRLVETAN